VQLGLYQKYYNVSNLKELVKLFQDSLIITNRTPEFFVDWEKVKKNADTIKIELALWNSLIGSSNIESDFTQLIVDYPEVIKTIPILLAIREREFPIIIDFFNIERGIKNLDFKKDRSSKITETEVRDYTEFVKKAGIFELFNYIKNFHDYVLGVEVGMDTNARKNRSGQAMELVINPLIQEIANNFGFKVFFQEQFRVVEVLGGKVPISLANRKSDFILASNNKFVNIEVNYFSGPGSKPEEIVDSYINRRNELESNNWAFIWITDGDVWRRSENQLVKAFNELDYLLNISFARKGLLQEALLRIFQT